KILKGKLQALKNKVSYSCKLTGHNKMLECIYGIQIQKTKRGHTRMINDSDMKHLRRCIELAKDALDAGDKPFGSVLVSGDGEVLAEDRNRDTTGDPTQHPEFSLARWAAQNMAPDERKKATVYTSGEHCPMCSA